MAFFCPSMMKCSSLICSSTVGCKCSHPDYRDSVPDLTEVLCLELQTGFRVSFRHCFDTDKAAGEAETLSSLASLRMTPSVLFRRAPRFLCFSFSPPPPNTDYFGTTPPPPPAHT